MLLMLSACASAFDVLPEKMGGLPASAPARPAETAPFPNVYEQRPTREARPLSDDEQKKLESELTTLREQQKQMSTAPYPPREPPPPAPPAKKAASKTPAKAVAGEKKEAAPKPIAEQKKKSVKQKDAVVPDIGSAPLKPIN